MVRSWSSMTSLRVSVRYTTVARIAVRKITLVTRYPRPRPCSVGRGREPVTEVRTQRAGQDVGQPERQHGVRAQPPADHDRDDQAGRQEHRRTRTPTGELQGPVTRRGTEGEGDQNREPVEQLSRQSWRCCGSTASARAPTTRRRRPPGPPRRRSCSVRAERPDRR